MLGSNLPFTIVCVSGERYEVAHPDFISVAPGEGTSVIVYGKDGVGFSLLDLSTISDVQLKRDSQPTA
ncbi:MAG: hypothetical protein AAGA58_00295 [Verrucomicrobiota bacterium]